MTRGVGGADRWSRRGVGGGGLIAGRRRRAVPAHGVVPVARSLAARPLRTGEGRPAQGRARHQRAEQAAAQIGVGQPSARKGVAPASGARRRRRST